MHKDDDLLPNTDQETKCKVRYLISFEEGRVGKRYGRLVLVAEAHILGILRAVHSRETSALVTAFVNMDLGHVKTDEMPKHLQDVLQL